MEIDRYIEQAEIILLNGGTFDDERNDFIKNLETCDLLAVPGSGKTTALLAKLYCIAQNMPFEDGSGILVLSHTNHAIEEIEKKLKTYCPKLFEYPNFIGTIQSFVNKFLTIPFYEDKNHKRIISIDDEYHNYRLNKIILESFIANTNLKHIYRTPKIPWKYNFELSETPNQIIDLGTKNRIVITKPRGRAKNPVDWSITEKNNLEKNLYKIKLKLLTDGILNFNDSYFYAKIYLRKIPIIKKILQQRFKLIFIDEMQDLEDFQINLIDEIFFNNTSNTIIQRIGDKNQSIYNSVKENCDWKTRQEIDPDNYTDLSIQNSIRLSPIIASLVDKFALTKPQNYSVIGKFGESTIAPQLILIDHDTSGKSLKAKFKEIIEEHNLHTNSKNIEKGFHIISWTTEKDNSDVLCLKKLFPNFSKESKKKKEDFDCLKKHLFLFDREKSNLEAIKKSILNSLIRILDLENIKAINDKNYTKSKLISFIINQGEEVYENFKNKLFKWCFNIVTQGNYNEIYEEIKNFIESENFIGLNWYSEEEYTPKRILASREFINKDFPFESEEDDETAPTETTDYPINLSSVHSVKGQTHCATMYVESAYQRPAYETLKIIKKGRNSSNPLLLEEHKCDGTYDKQALKMMYVGFSRPTHLLCFAVLKENIEEHLESLKIENGGIWRVIDDLIEND